MRYSRGVGEASKPNVNNFSQEQAPRRNERPRKESQLAEELSYPLTKPQLFHSKTILNIFIFTWESRFEAAV